MLKKYNNYLNENTDNNYTVECEIDKEYLLKISGQSNINDAINNEFGWIKSIILKDIKKIDNKNYQLIITVNNQILEDTDTQDIIKGIYSEFQWLVDSGIHIKNVN